MCTAPAPKAPKFQRVDTYAAYKQHPQYDEFIKSSPKTKIDDDDDVRVFNEWLLQNSFDTEASDPKFMDAFTNLARQGTLSGAKGLNYTNREAMKFRSQYMQSNQGKADGWEGAYAYSKFNFSDEADLQRVYDERMRITQEDYMTEQDDMMKAQTDKFLTQQAEDRKANEALMKELMDQPMYTPQQAALPRVQYKAKSPKPVPAAPAPPPVMNISPTPAPELVNTGNQMGIVRQSRTFRDRIRQRTLGTASLT